MGNEIAKPSREIVPQTREIIFYKTDNGEVKVEILLQDENLWLTQAKKQRVMYMKDWIQKLDAFLQFNEEDILQNNGKVTQKIAKAFAESEFEKYRAIQDKTYKSDFDLFLQKTKGIEE